GPGALLGIAPAQPDGQQQAGENGQYGEGDAVAVLLRQGHGRLGGRSRAASYSSRSSAIEVGAGPGQVVAAVLARLDREDLVQVHPAALEAVGAAGQVQAPDAQGLLRHQRRRLLQTLLQALAPQLQGARVVQAQALDVDDLQAGFADRGADGHQVRQLALGEDVAVDELAGATPDRAAVGVTRGDAVVQHQPAGLYRAEQALTVQRQVGVADVLEHADADHLVETAVLRQVAIVQQLQGHALFKPFLDHALAAQLQLRLAEGDAEHLGAELAGG